jgi:DNA helicase-2/ATP-dependent DNA helicase PcrA
MNTLPNLSIIDSLNEAQRAVVTAALHHLLVLAGAGSGKTRVLVHRIAWLVETHGVSPDEILSVTFTNKAAAEMRNRLENMLQYPMQRMWVGTFHGLAHRLLRRHWMEAGLPQSFQILDSDDQLRFVRRVIKNFNLDEERWPARQAQWFINAKKEEGLRPDKIVQDGDMFNEMHTKIYRGYEEICRTSGLVDFSELLLRSYELWESHPDLLAQYQQRFKHIMVDEFQDTNWIQYQWIKKLAGQSAKLMMVGDDDQSIYSWRGAKVENLRRFVNDFSNVKTIRLEQNYRSTATILQAANAVIACNQNRLGKNLWTQDDAGELVSLYAAFNDRDEARFIINQIREWIKQGGKRQEAAILYRSNAQSRVLEEELIQANMAYRVYGGLKFFERAEIKDVLGYMRLMSNADDDGAFERIVNMPTRGIGETTLTTLREYAKENNVSLWKTAQHFTQNQLLSSRATTALAHFLSLIENMIQVTTHLSLQDLTEYVLIKSGLMAHHQEDRSEKALARVENLEELINATSQFVPDAEATALSPLAGFLSHVALESGDHEADHLSDAVHLMTLHSAKGLEFPLVFLTGMEEGLFPHAMSSQKPAQLEEERRLCYVGMTRAMRKLYLTYAETRYLRGQEMRQRPSRFIREIPVECLNEIRLKAKISRPVSYTMGNTTMRDRKSTVSAFPSASSEGGFPLGSRVKHANFGEGIVLSWEGSGAHARVQVKFKSGVKWLVMGYANLQAV